MKKTILFLFVLFGILNVPLAQSWKPTAGPVGGYVIDIAVNPKNPAIIYAGTLGGKLFKTENEGDNWSCLQLFDSDVISVTVDPHNTNKIYAGTAENGLFISTNAGESWIRKSFTDSYIYCILVDHTDPDIIYVTAWEEGVYKTTNGGDSWSLVNVGLGYYKNTCSLVMDPTDHSILYLGTKYYIYKTTSGGDVWTKQYGRGLIQYFNLVIDPDTPDIIYASSRGYGVLKSTDGGTNWETINDGLQTNEIGAIAISKINNSSVIYAGSTDGQIFKSKSEGSTWSLATTLPFQTPVRDIAAMNNKIYIAGEGDGVVVYEDAGDSWESQNSGLLNMKVWSLTHNPSDENILFAGTEIGGIYMSENGGSSWKHVKQLRNVYSIVIDKNDPDILYAGTYGDGIFKSSDGGTTWNAYNSGLSNQEVWDVTIDPTNSNIVFAATSRGLFKTADGGQNWVRTSLTSYSEVYSVLVNSEEPNKIYASMKGCVYHSTDGGSTWNELGSGISYSDYIFSLAYKHGTPDVIFAGGGHIDYSDNIQGSLYSLAIGSSSWSEILDKAYCSEIFSVPKSNDIYISTFNDGIFHSSNGGSTWKKLDAGIPYSTSDAITVTSSSVYGGFRFGSVWKTDVATSLTSYNDNSSKSYRLYQNYPNPFSSFTTLKYFLPQSTKLRVTVYDIKGNTIRILYEGHLNPGSYSIHWDGLNDNGQAVSSGIYFYQIKTPGFQDARSMILRR